MKYTFSTIIATTALLLAGNTFAQTTTTVKTEVTTTDTAGKKKLHRNAITISNDGIYMGSNDSTWKKKKAARRFFSTVSVNLGANFLQDNTNYNDPSVINYLSNVPGAKKNAQLFNLNQAKSINFNVYWLRAFKAIDHKAQKLTISSGLGLQIYNFRYDNNISYTKTPSIIQDTISFTKNKLAIDYLNVPLTFTFKTRIHKSESGKKSTWLVYGAGITAGYRISAWTKQKSDARGKVKMHDDFGLNDFNSCLTAEIGIDDVIRFYGSYQLTSIYKNNNIDQHPISIGIKLIGI